MLKLSRSIYESVRRHGEETYPYECCGALVGRSAGEIREIMQTIPTNNIRADSAHNRYQIAPQDLIRIQRNASEQGLDIIGFYHSHPDHAARWSSTDFAEAHWLGCSYVITSIVQGKADETNSFLLAGTTEDDKQFVDEVIEITGC
jgi:proteasome lid subunit RPN8/RPN11